MTKLGAKAETLFVTPSVNPAGSAHFANQFDLAQKRLDEREATRTARAAKKKLAETKPDD